MSAPNLDGLTKLLDDAKAKAHELPGGWMLTVRRLSAALCHLLAERDRDREYIRLAERIIDQHVEHCDGGAVDGEDDFALLRAEREGR